MIPLVVGFSQHVRVPSCTIIDIYGGGGVVLMLSFSGAPCPILLELQQIASATLVGRALAMM
jgi:hypothetical protein